jgi:hypothetical protein
MDGYQTAWPTTDEADHACQHPRLGGELVAFGDVYHPSATSAALGAFLRMSRACDHIARPCPSICVVRPPKLMELCLLFV